MQKQAGALEVCLLRSGGALLAIGAVCPHRGAPMAEGWLEDGAVVCPWHSWAFDPRTGTATYPEGQRIDAFPLRVEGDAVLVEVP